MLIPLRTFITAGFLSASFSGGAQGILTPGNVLPNRYLNFYWEPLSILDPAGSSIRLGAQYAGPRWSFYGEGGDYLFEGYVLRAGIQWRVKGGGRDRYSLAIEGEHCWHFAEEQDNYTTYQAGIGSAPDPNRPVNYGVGKNNSSLSLLFTYQKCILWEKITFEVFAGLGVKFRDAWVNIPLAKQDSLYHFTAVDNYILPFQNARGRWATFTMPAGITFGYLLPLRKRRR